MYTIPSLPRPIREDWNRLEQLRPYVLELSYADGGSASKDTLRKSTRLISTILGVDRLTLVHQKISMLHEMGSMAVPPRTILTSVVIPSTRYLDHVDAQRSGSIDDIREEIRPRLHLFEDLLANPIQFEYNHQDMSIEDIIELFESFYMLKPIEEKWGRWGSWKCMREAYMSGALRGHSLLMASMT
jgi:hypothetical protein